MKRYIMEFIGTFFLTIAISLTGNPIAIGLMLIAMVYLGGHISGGHFNPAISFACFVNKTLTMNHFAGYCAAQSLGALLALYCFMMITGNIFSLDMVAEGSVVAPFGVEALLTMVFCWVYLTMVVGRNYRATAIHGIVIGLTLMAIVFIGGIFNPAVALGSVLCDLFKNGTCGEFSGVLVYIIAPLVGGALASVVYDYFNNEIVPH